jgi:hypothetical protein
VPSWIYDALSSFQSFMERGSFLDLVGTVVVAGAGSILLVAVHELGHALGARARGAPVHTIRMGDRAVITLCPLARYALNSAGPPAMATWADT